jgi:hypothetical protein
VAGNATAFETPVKITSFKPFSLLLADVDRDGRDDCVAVGADGLRIFFASGSEALLADNAGYRHETPGVVSSCAMTVADATPGGNLEILLAGPTPRYEVILELVAVKDGGLAETVSLRTPAGTPSGIAVSDIDQDGLPEVAVSLLGVPGLLLFRGTPRGPAGPEEVAIPDSSAVVAFDLQNDGVAEFLAPLSHSPSVARIKGVEPKIEPIASANDPAPVHLIKRSPSSTAPVALRKRDGKIYTFNHCAN